MQDKPFSMSGKVYKLVNSEALNVWGKVCSERKILIIHGCVEDFQQH